MSNKAAIINELVNNTNGKAFTVTFEKANGELRTLTGRTGVTKHLKGSEATYNGRDGDKGNIGVYEMVKDELGRWATGAYKCFNSERVLKMKVGGKEYEF